jgi:polysaccharide export outer membrane protein
MKTLLKIAAIAAVFVAQSEATLIQPRQVVQITIANVPPEDKSTVNGTYPVSQSGMINMPHIGQVRAAGLLPEQLQASLEARYRSAQIYRHPTIQVIASSIDTLVEQVIYMAGDVGSVGPVKYVSGITLHQAIQAAGGATEFGSMRRVKLYRNGKHETYDLTKDQFRGIPLQPNDTVEVMRKRIIEW